MAKQTVDDDLYGIFLGAFQTLLDPAQLGESQLRTSCLVQQVQKQRPELLPYQALKATFEKTLDLLAKENADWADLLRGRFFEGLQIEEMLAQDRPRPMGKRSFSNHQRDAIHAFAFLFEEREAHCLAMAAEPPPASYKSEESAPGLTITQIAMPVAILCAIVGGWLLMRNQPSWKTDTAGLIETIEDRERGEVTQLQGVAESGDLEDFHWSQTSRDLNLSWLQKGSDYAAVYIEMETSNGRREFKFVPEDDAPVFADERYQIGMGINSRDDEWHLYDYDLQAIAADLEPGIALEKLVDFYIRSSGKVLVDNVQFTAGSPTNITSAARLNDADVVQGELSLDEWRFYQIAVPDNASKLTVQLQDLSADFDLYIRRNARPTGHSKNGGVYDCHSQSNGLQNEVCVLNQASGSIWYIGVWGDEVPESASAVYTLITDYDQPTDTGVSAWRTDGQGNVSQENTVTHLQGNGDSTQFDQFRYLPAAGNEQFTVSWELNAADYVAVYIEVDTLNGERTFKFSPDDKAAVFSDGNRYKVGTPAAFRDGDWHLYEYDLQAMAAELEPGVVLREITAFYVGSSGEAWLGNVAFE